MNDRLTGDEPAEWDATSGCGGDRGGADGDRRTDATRTLREIVSVLQASALLWAGVVLVEAVRRLLEKAARGS